MAYRSQSIYGRSQGRRSRQECKTEAETMEEPFLLACPYPLLYFLNIPEPPSSLSDVGNSSIERPSSQVTLVCVKVTSTNGHKNLATQKPFPNFNLGSSLPHHISHTMLLFEIGSPYATKTGFKLKIPLPEPLHCCDYRSAGPCLARSCSKKYLWMATKY